MEDGSLQLICGCCTRLTIGLTYHGHLILSLLEIYPLLNSGIVYAFFICFMLAAYTHLGLLSHNPIINVLEGFLSSFNKPVAEFRILHGCVMFYYYMLPRVTFEKFICGTLMGVFSSCNVLASFIVDRPKIML